MKPLVAFLLGLVIVAAALADDFDTWSEASPDKALFAIERRIPDPSEPSRLDLDGIAVFICHGVSGFGSVVTPGALIARQIANRGHVCILVLIMTITRQDFFVFRTRIKT